MNAGDRAARTGESGTATSAMTAGQPAGPPPMVEVRDVQMHFPLRGNRIFGGGQEVVRAVDSVSISIARGDTLGLVGESGCGKSTLARVVAGLHRPTAGRVLFDGIDLATLPPTDLRRLRRRFQIVSQDPYLSLDPRMTVGRLIGEGLVIHGIGTPRDRAARVAELMELVGLRRQDVDRYSHEFSGGQRQRIAIARALAPEPELVILDEPVSALDVSIQAQILALLVDLQRQLGLTYLLIGHDLAVIASMCRQVAVMYLGRIVETLGASTLSTLPLHPYTRALLSSMPIPDPQVERTRRRIILEGDVPSPIDPPPGCRFHTRCPLAESRCRIEVPGLREVPLPGRRPGDVVACHRAEAVADGKDGFLLGTRPSSP